MKTFHKIQALAIAFVMTVALAGSVVLAQSTDTNPGGKFGMQGFGRHGHHGRMMDAIFSKLNLTDAQKTQIEQIKASHRDNILPLIQQIRAKRQEIRQSTQSGAFDEAVVTQKLTELAPLKAKLMSESFKMHQEMLNVLTPDQKTQLDQMREQFKNKMHNRMGGGSSS